MLLGVMRCKRNSWILTYDDEVERCNGIKLTLSANC